jgi:cytochrome b561
MNVTYAALAIQSDMADVENRNGDWLLSALLFTAVTVGPNRSLVDRAPNSRSPPETSGATKLAGRVSHWLLVVVPVTGLLRFYYGDPYGEWHTYAKPVFIGLIALHVAASSYHQFWHKDGLLMRILKPSKAAGR